PARPFSVQSGAHLVQVVGTSFSVYRDTADKTEVIVEEGTVRVKESVDFAISRELDVVKPPTLMVGGDKLSAGDIGIFGNAAPLVDVIDHESLGARLAWREGKLVFRGDTLEAALAQISRYTTTRFEFLDEKAKQLTVAGVFQSGDVEGLLRTLKANFDIAYQRIDDDLILIGIR
ncbi:MAG: FecR domain-containing protein, partial [Pseudomonadales bacterium]